jgi:four helix bundle protein
MSVTSVRDLETFKRAREFKREVYALVRAHPAAYLDFKYRAQLWDAAASGESNIDEGFKRCSPGVFAHYLGISRASVSEAVCRVEDGVDRGYFTAAEIAPVVTLGTRTLTMIAALQRSQKRRAAMLKGMKSTSRRRTN